MVKSLNKINTKTFLIFLYVFHVLLFWPGIMTADSHTQYQMAITGQYHNHHPFLMSYLWHYLDLIVSGSGLILCFHLGLLYVATYFFCKAFEGKRLSFYALFLPFVPFVFAYSGKIWKDVGFAFAFLCVAGYLSYLTMRQKKLSWALLPFPLIVLTYGTMVKFQAQYLAPIMLGWITFCLCDYRLGLDSFVKWVTVNASFVLLIVGLHWVGPSVEENHTWQRTKLFDIAAISLATHKDLIPNCYKNPSFSMSHLEKVFESRWVDPLIRSKMFRWGTFENQRKELYETWKISIVKYPLDYFVHRCKVLGQGLMGSFRPDSLRRNLNHVIDGQSFFYLPSLYLSYLLIMPFVGHLVPLIISGLYLVLAMKTPGGVRARIPLFFLSLCSLIMPMVLFFFSMAGTTRYTYISICFWAASHLFAYECFHYRRRIVKMHFA